MWRHRFRSLKYLETPIMDTPRFRAARRLAAALAALTLITAITGLAATRAAADERFVMVSHGSDSNVWWNTVKNGMRDASEDFNVPVDYRNPPSGDTGDMVRILEQAAARNYSGVITTVPN